MPHARPPPSLSARQGLDAWAYYDAHPFAPAARKPPAADVASAPAAAAAAAPAAVAGPESGSAHEAGGCGPAIDGGGFEPDETLGSAGPPSHAIPPPCPPFSLSSTGAVLLAGHARARVRRGCRPRV